MMLVLIVFSTIPVSAEANSIQSYIVQGSDLATVVELVEAHGGQISMELEVINSVAADLDPQMVKALFAEKTITSIFPNENIEASSFTSENDIIDTGYPEATGANYVTDQGITGQGVTVAILDSGLANYNSLENTTDKQNRILAWIDFVEGKNNLTDPNGHGTHITGIIANSETGSDGSYNGVAPDANLVIVRILDKDGYGTYSNAIQGIEWVIEHKEEYNIKLINLSLTAEANSPYWADPLNQAVMKAWAAGITVITCTGNTGPDPLTITVPGNNPYVITVGAFTDAYTPLDMEDDYLASFSSSGPTLDAFAKPDLIAPGAHMVSPMSNGNQISKDQDATRVPGTHYYEMAGTSQAAATVTGIAALMYQQNPDLTPDEVKHRLMMTSTSMPFIEGHDVSVQEGQELYSVFQQGAGRVNALDAVFAEGINGQANQDMDIWADINGDSHYQGYAVYDVKQDIYTIQDVRESNNSYASENDNPDIQSGGLGLWSGGLGLWSGGLGLWSGGLGLWSGGLGLWSGGLGLWSGGLGLWSGSVSNWVEE